jgi:hypothetical protein
VNAVFELLSRLLLAPLSHFEVLFTLFLVQDAVHNKNLPPERRASKRFSIERRIRYRTLGRGSIGISDSGRTVNMSSVGMLITTDRVLSVGWCIEVEVDGPFQVDDQSIGNHSPWEASFDQSAPFLLSH